ncbi:MAG: hypothetical protein OXP71_18110 [Candidatus Poribacteria bacterium]|nr:hypothetical protein [Candidatus Poribacteria bacterium]
MQSKRPIRAKRDLLDQKWLTYFLIFVLLLLIAIFVLSLRYQDSIVRHAKRLLHHAKQLLNRKKSEPPRPRPMGMRQSEKAAPTPSFSLCIA